MDTTTVAIGGSVCTILQINDREIVCDTASRGSSIKTNAQVIVDGVGAALEVGAEVYCPRLFPKHSKL